MGTSSRGNSLKGVRTGARATEVPGHPWKRDDLAWAGGRRGRKQAETAGLLAPGGASSRQTRCLPPGLRPCARNSSAWGLPALRLARQWTGHQEPEDCVLALVLPWHSRGASADGMAGGEVASSCWTLALPSLLHYTGVQDTPNSASRRKPTSPGHPWPRGHVCVSGGLSRPHPPACSPPPSATSLRGPPAAVRGPCRPHSPQRRGSGLTAFRPSRATSTRSLRGGRPNPPGPRRRRSRD